MAATTSTPGTGSAENSTCLCSCEAAIAIRLGTLNRPNRAAKIARGEASTISERRAGRASPAAIAANAPIKKADQANAV